MAEQNKWLIYTLSYTSNFDKGLKRAAKRGYNIKLLENIIQELENTGKVDAKYLPHKLKGKYADCMECHVRPDWVLIWSQDNQSKNILLIATGTHTDLF